MREGCPDAQAVRAAERYGIRLLVPDRPGYGRPTRRPGRRVVDVVDDIVLLADRVRRCASVVGPAPFDADGLDWFAGMSAGNVEEFTLARSGEAAYRPLAERLAREAVAAVEAGQVQVPPGYDLPAVDVAALQARLAEPGHRQRTRLAYVGGVDGWVDDVLALTRPWGFLLVQLTVPVSVWYGPRDVLSPRGHAEWLLARVPDAERRELPSGGHLLGGTDLDGRYAWLTVADG